MARRVTSFLGTQLTQLPADADDYDSIDLLSNYKRVLTNFLGWVECLPSASAVTMRRQTFYPTLKVGQDPFVIA